MILASTAKGLSRLAGAAIAAAADGALEGGAGLARKRIDGGGQALEDDATDIDLPRHDRLGIGLVIDVDLAARAARACPPAGQKSTVEGLLDLAVDGLQRDDAGLLDLGLQPARRAGSARRCVGVICSAPASSRRRQGRARAAIAARSSGSAVALDGQARLRECRATAWSQLSSPAMLVLRVIVRACSPELSPRASAGRGQASLPAKELRAGWRVKRVGAPAHI